MKQITIAPDRILQTPQGYQFIPLGNADGIFGNGGLLDQVKDKLFLRKRAPLEDFWGTIGRQDGKAITWKGVVNCSTAGNMKSTGIVSDEISALKELSPQIGQNGNRAVEKVIDFDNVQFDGSQDPGSRQLRLTLMVDPGEGAIVFYQHTDAADTTSQDGLIEFIQPAETPNYNDNQRDRLDYYFTVPPKADPSDRFVVKAITFQRDPQLSPEALLQKIENPYRLLRYNVQTNTFDQLTNGLPAADRTLKTLLLIHGTFSTTDKSYGGLISSGWLTNVINTGLYQQVIALDHPTILEGPAQNVAKLVELMGPGPKFTQPMHIITTSRGGLVGKTIVNDKSIDASLFTVERVAAQACANGVMYFSTGENISKGLGVLKAIFKIAGRGGLTIFTTIAQVGVNFFLSQPGCQAMTPGSAPLTTILEGTPVNPGMRYYPVTGNYSPDTLGQRLINVLVKDVYGTNPNDWVVGTTQQVIMPEGHLAYSKKGLTTQHYFTTTYDSMHTKYLNMDPPPPQGQPAPGIPRDAILAYLKDSYSNIL